MDIPSSAIAKRHEDARVDATDQGEDLEVTMWLGWKAEER